MNHAEQFAEFLHCCREQRVKRILLAELCLLFNPSSGDFGSVLIEFEECNYFVTSKYLPHEPGDVEINEFHVKKFRQLSELQEDDLTEKDLYKTLSTQEHSITFITEMVDEDGYFNGMEWKLDDGYLFFFVDCPTLSVVASYDEPVKYLLYSHQFGEGNVTLSDDCYELFPDA